MIEFKCNCLRKSPIQKNRLSQIDFSCCFSESPKKQKSKFPKSQFEPLL